MVPWSLSHVLIFTSLIPDTAGELSFIQWLHKMPTKTEDTIRLFDRGDFFSVHGEDAILMAATVYKTQSVLKVLGKGKDAVPSCTLNMTAGRNFLREALTSKQLKIEIWGGGTSKKHSWTLEKQVSIVKNDTKATYCADLVARVFI
jgi:DNA mismatch repair protein MSH2